MTVSLFAIFAVVFALVALVIMLDLLRITRRLRHAGATRAVVVATAVIVAIIDMYRAALPDAVAGPFQIATLTLNMVALAGIPLLLDAQRITPRTTRLPRRILAIGAHPDDLEIACGGTLAKFVDSGHEVHGLVMSGGGRGGDGCARPGEALAAAQFMRLTSLSVLGLPDTELPAHQRTMIEAIETTLSRLNADIVLTHSINDVHQDHQAVYLATMRAARNHPAILSYESPSANEQFMPRWFVDIDQYFDVKATAVSAHRDQAGKSYLSKKHMKAVAVVRGAQARTRYAEGFEVVRLLDTRAADL
ncbi:MAG TPA: PIG-L deacetylase family protein [Pseudonocardiaceae bacterium]|nr:PIG-L deacetylase family protein [Pseudonocardiaceae bacterium]